MKLVSWQKNQSLRMVLVAAIAFFVLCLLFNLHRYYSFYASYDQGIFNQVFWNSTHGRFFQSSLSSALSTNVVHQGQVPEVYYHRLGQHFTPALLLWLPIYALFPYPITLTVLQVTLVTGAGLVLYILARQYLQPPLSAIITISFYCANAVIGPTLANFHDICQIPIFVFSLLLAMEKRRWSIFWILAILILAVREDAGVVLFGVGFYLILSKRYPKIGLAICTLSFAYMVALTNLIMPIFSEDISQRFMMERFGQYADGDEASTLEIIWGMISNPWRLIGEIFTPFFGTIKYLLGQWLPLAFVPAVAPASWMIAGFPLLKLFSAQGLSVLSITIRYAMTVVPGLFYGAILWWGNRESEVENSPLPSPKFQRFWVICICLSLFFTFTSNPNRTFYFLVPDSVQPWVYVPAHQQWQHVSQMRPLLAKIPDDASVAATTYIIPHLSGRRAILRFPRMQFRNDAREVEKVEYIIVDLWRLNRYRVAFKSDRQRLEKIVPRIEELYKSGEYGITGFADGVILMEKGVVSNLDAVDRWEDFRREIVGAIFTKNSDK
ncbi:DUF2079 domain-containing protein [Okeania sp. SIO1I7]|uniref:DUF2079 domain-containing protein n=1 Tax=Okeania sp. SIO1I7 TaxID=2607772 RepID=UPI0013FC3975|nr:DUF2079 domain-containing protein [Okeania sp. SIO1I7]NET29075.1 DUF2079 domain-containing protein [Okeania sp. SIO1I7]